MIDNLFTAALTVCLLVGATLALVSAAVETAPAAAAPADSRPTLLATSQPASRPAVR
jgi:hypothetical protein